MTPAVLRDGEVQYYASPVLIKKTQYYATLTNQRLLIEGPKNHEFSVTSLQGAYPELLEGTDRGLKLIISTPKGQRDMIWAFPVEDIFKQGEIDSWIEAVSKAMGDKPFATGTFAGVKTASPLGEAHSEGIRFNDTIEIGAAAIGASAAEAPAAAQAAPSAADSAETPAAAAATAAAASAVSPPPETKPPADAAAPAVDLIRGETIAVSTAGVRVKRTFYTAYLTNIRLILQNNLGKIGRAFAIAEIKDAAEMESDAGEPEIAVSVGTQNGLKQMLLIFPTAASRSAWMIELRNKLPRRAPPAPQDASVSKARIGTFTPATNERVIITTPGVHIKNRLAVLHLTNTRFVVDSANGIVGEFAVSTLNRAVRMASELGEPGISLTIASPAGEREMHPVFASMNDREAWMDALQQFLPEEGPAYGAAGYGAAGYGSAGYAGSAGGGQYTVTQVRPRQPANSQIIECPNCGAQNPASEAFCALCGSALHGGYKLPAGNTGGQSGSTGDRPQRERRPSLFREHKERPPRPEYTGGIIGFISRPRDAFSYYAHESPKAAFPLFLVFGAIWAVLTAVCITYLLPLVVNLEDIPIFTALQEDVLLLVIFIIFLWIIWVLALLVHAVITGLVARIFSPSAKIPEAVAITMRSSLTFAFVGWIPIFGMFAASIWTAISSWFGLRLTQDTSAAGAAIAAFAGAIVVYVGLFILGGGFA